ncbi:hypothetical protein FGU65_02480 [Methanoculleus sp. FWC-SCC1]|uniref:V-type ATP synthase subunit F n=1 Tax=Methanoculleus frigidifontis TaxID=2584085 RepID=A0ABT8M762_9EURY|nr:V-type ATP synthase subunit F [Methanoculleus sp. FWC-SCC1]MDN7023772.1 hypothetical protein [Methanoculleus sp. FWC-SCC1]
MKIAAIGGTRMVAGFALAGVKRTYFAADTETAAEALLDCIRDPEVGVILLQESLAVLIADLLERVRSEKGAFPMIVACPGEEGRIPHEDRFARSVRALAALGMRESGGTA